MPSRYRSRSALKPCKAGKWRHRNGSYCVKRKKSCNLGKTRRMSDGRCVKAPVSRRGRSHSRSHNRQYGPHPRPLDYFTPLQYGPLPRPEDFITPVYHGPSPRPAGYSTPKSRSRSKSKSRSAHKSKSRRRVPRNAQVLGITKRRRTHRR